MNYKIEQSHDLERGALLTVQFPEAEVDKKAFYTIQNDMPDFLLPFTSRWVNGMLECTYQVGNLMKLEYRFGVRRLEDYTRCWNLVLQPLIECRDWFLNPYSFVLDVSRLYTNREESRVKYVYIPSRVEAGSYELLKSMVMEISRQNTVDDPALENVVLKAVMQDFSPKGFLKTLSSYSQSVQKPTVEPENKMENPAENLGRETKDIQERVPKEGKAQAAMPGGEIQIHFGDTGKRKEKKSGENKEKKEKKKGNLFGLGKKRQEESSRVLGAPAELENRNGQQKREANRGAEEWAGQPEAYCEDDSVTMIDTLDRGSPYLVYIGNKPNMPRRIEVSLSGYGRFTIGRFDVALGSRQSDFEFEKSTRGVSRRHAVIEERGGSYFITDLQSSAGTYVDGKRLESNEACALSRDCRISFGYDGADYLWKC